MKRVRLPLAGKAYDIVVGRDGLNAVSDFLKRLDPSSVFILADARIQSSNLRYKKKIESSGFKTTLVKVRATEEFKSFESIYPLYGKLLQSGADRRSVLVAIGGGVI